jgi:hypothetical protein
LDIKCNYCIKVNQPKEGSIVFGVQTKYEILLLKIIENGLEMRKLQPPKIKGSRTQRNKPLNITKVGSLNTQKVLCMLLYCY